MESSAVIDKRKEKVFNYMKKSGIWVVLVLAVAVILGVYIRSMPMHDHGGGRPGLWDITRNDWTLGPDLDPWLFTRVAKETIAEGAFPVHDDFRNVPIGFDNYQETVLLPQMIVWTYKLVNMFGDYSVEFAAAFLPVIMFGLTIISFFLFVREIFIGRSKRVRLKANIIALISTFFMVVIPVFISRTIAGIPEKESVVFFFMFLSFYLILKAWNLKDSKKAYILGALSGLATACGALVSGLYIYIYVTLALAGLLAFILNLFDKKRAIVYGFWWLASAMLFTLAPGKGDLYSVMTSLTTAPAFILLIILGIHFIIWNTKLSQNKYLKKINLPQNIISLIIAVAVLLLGVLIINPSLIVDKIRALNQILFNPTTGRWNTTVAENRQPYFVSWVGSFGPRIANFPVFFWLFFIGSIVMFKKMLHGIKKKDSWILTGFYIFFFMGLVFSRYSPQSVFNGDNFISKAFYLVSVVLFVGMIIRYYLKYRKEKHKGFESIDFRLLFAVILFLVVLFSARGAVRLIMVLGPVVPIFVAYLMWESVSSYRKSRDDTMKIVLVIAAILIIVLGLFSFTSFYRSVKNQAYNTIPSHYNQQWQKAMGWVRDETPSDAVFGHWWDYGYWVQSIGERATVLDGGNAITFWNYWMGRLVLTGDNQEDALDFLYNHDTTHFLIDSTDIGKYGAFSSIGSDENYDRYSWIQPMVADEKQMRETSNGTMIVFSGGSAIDEDIRYINSDGSETFLPGQKAGIAGVTLLATKGNNTMSFGQPTAVYFYEGQRYEIPLRYLYFNGQFSDFGSGLEGALRIMPAVKQTSGQGVSRDDLGSAIYISPRVLRGFLAQKYLLDDPFGKFPNFKVVHVENNLIIENLNAQGMDLPPFVYYQGLQGPITIWEIEYTGNETKQEKYLDRDSSKYLSWKL